ncbi:MAG: hypothetical protein ACD_51C00248G0002 [uncultured bacterium]|nr:MAG: hypothetical protein ACD_51C00248G0002 [uncultured bacterium]OGJ47322.1 MAG: hypothetical protein A2244_00575 [Candidatus Peregrinibacteria bacterium RIFOXYA2_FULL_41_18]OGJ48375.1 MAG: hypothetical protein A2344_05220 [Candidatus Peregrinibacteria bacterium RIFOXYB12_FULL_41_12]OGJ53164.1 MAG: hypothetical protein A2336_01755 [Candidatus Peregrinibacteria bacterium RIFOXYB2_FULL_41_88]OGJ53444.1 MAG: hypothetical protein A2448_05010 [Candidatus Peregrinibacteria bacterium RIFOXYC2_FULL
MKLIITASIKKVEFEPAKSIFDLDIIKTAAKKSLEGLGDTVKSSNKIPSTCLKKVYLTSSSGAGRVIFLLKLNSGKSVLVMIRQKQDKKIGANMTVQNPNFVKALDKNLDIILDDLQKGKYEELDL